MTDDNSELLQRLIEQIEQAWNARLDHEIVDRLAAENPTLAFELYEFFADVLEAEHEYHRPRPELAASDERVKAWLEREGFNRVAGASKADESTSTTPSLQIPAPPWSSFVKLLKDSTGKRIADLAMALDVTDDFLVGASDNPQALPKPARLELARRAQQQLGIEQQRSLVTLSVAGIRYQKAASRTKAYAPGSTSYADLVTHSALTGDQKEFWLSLQDAGVD